MFSDFQDFGGELVFTRGQVGVLTICKVHNVVLICIVSCEIESWQRIVALHNPTDIKRISFRENSFGKAVFATRLQ